MAHFEEWISSVKKGKFKRDVHDYNQNQVYEWRGRDRTPGTLRPILKKKENVFQHHWDQSKNVCFSSTSLDSSEGPNDTSCDNDSYDRHKNNSSNCSKKNNKSRNVVKNDTAEEVGENIGGAKPKIKKILDWIF